MYGAENLTYDMKIEAICSSEMLVNNQNITWRDSPEDHYLCHLYRKPHVLVP